MVYYLGIETKEENGMKAERHENADMICAKANNMNLVVLAKSLKWHKVDSEDLQFFNQHEEYFLCLPQHNENGQMLHWLNGGHETLECTSPHTDGFEQCYSLGKWISDGGYMRSDCEYRIKPKKEKRWIVWDEDRNKYHCSFGCNPKGDYSANFKYSIHEIEVEV